MLKKYFGILLIILLALSFISCSKNDDDDDAANNHIPTITSVSPSSTRTGRTISLAVSASDEDASDNLTYLWSVNVGNGTLAAPVTQSTVLWTAPSTAGTYYVTIKVSDGTDSTSYTHSISVSTGGSTDPMGTISGFVMDLTGNLYKNLDPMMDNESSLFTFVRNATVRVMGIDSLSVITGSDGVYMFSGIPYGAYTIAVSADNYNSIDSMVTLASRETRLDFYMQSIIPDYLMTVTPTSIDMGTSIAEGYIKITNSGRNNISFNLSESEAWMNLSRTSGSLGIGDEDSIKVTIDRSDLAAGDFSGNVSVTSPQTDGATVVINFTVAGLSIDSIYITEDTLYADSTYTILSQATYNGTSSLSYTWNTSFGTLTPDSNEASWLVPDSAGDCSIELIVADGTIADTLSRNFTITEIIVPEKFGVQITNPADSADVNLDSVLIEVDVSLISGGLMPSRVNINIDGDSIATATDDDLDSVYTYIWDPEEAVMEHTISAYAFHSDGISKDTANVIIVNAMYLTFNFDSPTDSDFIFSGDNVDIDLDIDLLHSSYSINSVEFFIDDVSIGTGTGSAPDNIYSLAWSTTGYSTGNHDIKASISINTPSGTYVIDTTILTVEIL